MNRRLGCALQFVQTPRKGISAPRALVLSLVNEALPFGHFERFLSNSGEMHQTQTAQRPSKFIRAPKPKAA